MAITSHIRARAVVCLRCGSHALHVASCGKWFYMCGWVFLHIKRSAHVPKLGQMCGTCCPQVFWASKVISLFINSWTRRLKIFSSCNWTKRQLDLISYLPSLILDTCILPFFRRLAFYVVMSTRCASDHVILSFFKKIHPWIFTYINMIN